MNKIALLAVAALLGTVSATAAMAADLSMPMQSAPAFTPAPASSWDGAYIGANVGYAWGTANDPDTGFSGLTTSTQGWSVGGQVGYNFHIADSIVLGVQGNLDWTNETGSLPGDGSFTKNWQGAVVGRAGVDMGAWMPYVEAGVAFENATAAPPSGYNYPSFSNTQTGWTAGAGVQVMLASNVSADLEYRYSDYGNATYNGYTIANNDSQVRVGLNYHF